MGTYAICSTNWWNNYAEQANYADYYNSLSAWVSARAGAITEDEIAEIQGDDWQTEGWDTIEISLNSFSSSNGSFVRIRAIGLARHLGKWDVSRYILKVADTAGAIAFSNSVNVEVDGLQIQNQGNGTYQGVGISRSNTGSAVYIIKNCITWLSNESVTDGNSRQALNLTGNSADNRVYNNVLISTAQFGYGLSTGYSNGKFYNNTVKGFGIGIKGDGGEFSNNISIDNTTPYDASGGTFTYNAYDSGTDPGLNGIDISGETVYTIFTDPDNHDYSLLETAVSVRQKGANYDTIFTTDIAGQTRPASTDDPSAWDLGAWHYSGTAVGDPVDIKIQNAVIGTMILVLDPSDDSQVSAPFSMIADSTTITYEYFNDTLLELRARKSSVGDPVRYRPLTMQGICTNQGLTFYLLQSEDTVLN